MAADRTPNELAAKLERSQNAYTTMMSDGHNSIIVRSKDDELAECYRLMAEAAVLLREQAEQLDIQTALATNYAGKAVEYKQEKERAEEQLDTLLNAIGDACRTLADIAFEVGPVDDYTYRNAHALRDTLLDALAAAGGGVPQEGARFVEVDYWCHFDDKGRATRVHDASTVHMDGCTRMYVRVPEGGATDE